MKYTLELQMSDCFMRALVRQMQPFLPFILDNPSIYTMPFTVRWHWAHYMAHLCLHRDRFITCRQASPLEEFEADFGASLILWLVQRSTRRHRLRRARRSVVFRSSNRFLKDHGHVAAFNGGGAKRQAVRVGTQWPHRSDHNHVILPPRQTR
uniref:Uncharacterized protein n=1 Tax=Sulfobacillus thermotolerans TaxID=338644 RepID=G5CJ49_9FIRM|nr:hypothetical protein [Sulfobacillus thermotolerans]